MKSLNALKESVDKETARRLASEIGTLLGSKPIASSTRIVGEAFYRYKVPFHTDAFYCFVSVSDRSYSFEAKHRKSTAAIADCAEFCVSLKHKVPHMFLGKRIGRVSRALGIAVFTQTWTPEGEVEQFLMEDKILSGFRALDFGAFDELFVSQMMLSSKGKLQSPEHCAEQVRRMRDLFEIIFLDAWDRHNPARGRRR